jgi:antitoxin HicB
MFAFSYPANLPRIREDKRILVTFPDFPASATDGTDMSEATEQAADCLGSAIAVALAYKEEIPRPSGARRRQRMVPVPLWIAPKLALYWRMRDLGLSNSRLARKLGVTEAVVRRLLDPDHASKTAKLEAALEALGQRVALGVENVAAWIALGLTGSHLQAQAPVNTLSVLLIRRLPALPSRFRLLSASFSAPLDPFRRQVGVE